MAGGGTLRTTARMLPEAAARGADPEPRKCRLRTSKRNFIEREALGYPQTVSVTEGEHPPGGRPGHSVHDDAERQAAGVLAAVAACRTSSSAPGYPVAALRVRPGGRRTGGATPGAAGPRRWAGEGGGGEAAPVSVTTP